MTLPIAQFWKLAVQSRLFSPADCQKLESAFSQVKGAANQGNAAALGEWLVAKRALSRYQVQALLAGRPGPFVFGDYCVYERVRSKEGRLAGLYRAMHVPTRHPVLLYFMPPEIAKNDEAWHAAAHQVAWACWVGHPFVCECHHLLDVGQFKLLAVENLTGAPVAARLTGGSRLAPQDACRLAYQAALGLARMHQLGLVHGEVRPDNLWLTLEGNLKLLQVPLAPEPLRGPAPLDWKNPTAKLLTAADYAAPELAYEGRAPDALTDIYALGATLFHLLRGAPPFAGGELASKMPRHAAEPIPTLATLGISTKLDQALAYMMAKDPGLRYQQAVQVAEALAYFVDPAAAAALPPTDPTLTPYDRWLRLQPRVPGMEVGSIPTGLQMAEYAAAQSAAAQQPAETMNPVEELTRDTGAGSAQEHGYFDPSTAAEQQFESFITPTPDPLEFVPVRTSAPVLDMDSVLDTASEPLRARPIAVGKRKSRGIDLTALAVLGGVLILAAIAGVFIWNNLKGTRDQIDDGGTVATNQRTDRPESPEKTATGAVSGSKQPSGAQTNTPAAGTAKPAAPDNSVAQATKPDAKPPDHNPPVSAKADSSDAVADDGHLLWASPTTGAPLELNYIASGARVVLAVRPANIVGRAGGDQILPALGPCGADAEQMLKTLTGLPLAQIDQVIAVWHDSGNGQLAPTLIVRTQEPLATGSLLPAWGNPIATKEGDETYYQGQPWSYYLPAKREGKLLIVGPTALIKEAIQSAGGSPAMSAHLERMLKDTDSDRDVTLAFIPGPLFSDNQGFFVGELAALRKPAETFFGDDVKAGLLSLHFGGNFFIEMRVLGMEENPGALSSQFADRTRSLPDVVEDAVNKMNVRYGVKLLHRFPEQLRVLAENTRNDTDDDEAVLRCYLPGIATQNLLLATELALAEQPLTRGPTSDAGSEQPQSIAELLKKKTTLTFPRDTLVKSLQMLLDDVGVKYEILGGDLQLEGITKNQSFGLDEKDKPAGEILRKIMLLANPDGKLVYVIKPKQPGGPETLFITTRASAAKRGDKLPPELQSATKPPKKKP